MDSVQRRLGSYNNARARSACIGTAFGSQLRNRFASECFEFFTHSIHSSPKIFHLRSATFRAQHWSNGVATKTNQQSVVTLNDSSRTVFACGNLPTRHAGGKSRPPFAIENAHDTSVASKRLNKSFAKKTRTGRFVTTIDNVEDWPASAFSVSRLGQQCPSIQRFERGCGANQKTRNATSPRSFNEYVARIPCWRLFLLKRFIVFIENNDR
jgi:hypothetical protein